MPIHLEVLTCDLSTTPVAEIRDCVACESMPWPVPSFLQLPEGWSYGVYGDFNAFLFLLGRNVNTFSARSFKNVFNSLLKAVCTRLGRGNILHIHVCNLIQANLWFVSLLELLHLRGENENVRSYDIFPILSLDKKLKLSPHLYSGSSSDGPY